ncbi:unnamed protein product [Heligmosomoides polygyrus]|uniref:DUF5641 domain-containing protein n=1 Tax=Heligmosomoides polygyrus TaxID=6339 RepID=A0A183F4Q1_HELPZ|nr:unnamed protein product [Heligmosomoides polygyrus]
MPPTKQASQQEEMSLVRPIDLIRRILHLLTAMTTLNTILHKCCVLFKRGSRLGRNIAAVGDVVLVSDPVLPRNEWKMGRITDLRRGSDGEVREAELITGTRKKIRRPVNLLIPLEVQDEEEQVQSPAVNEEHSQTSTAAPTEQQLYNLRPRTQNFEICEEHICKAQFLKNDPHLVRFPPEIAIHNDNGILKWYTGSQLTTMETECPAVDFCSSIDCWICLSVLLNQECWPLGAISVLALILYSVIAILHLLLYAPMTVRKPIRIMLKGVRILLPLTLRCSKYCLTRICNKLCRAPPPAHDACLAAALAITMFFLQILSRDSSCQQLNILEHHSTVCRIRNGMEMCSIALSEVKKISTFKQEACLRLTHNSTLVADVKIRWKGHYLRCNQETMHYTLSVAPHVVLFGIKCAAVNSSSLIPEQEEANSHLGCTGCLEPCGRSGCDCFYLSSGCLFFRVFATPKTRKIYEIFRCVRWTEQVKLEVEIENGNGRRDKQHFVVQTISNVPVELPQFKITLTSLSLPPTPVHASIFITDGIDRAIWNTHLSPVLHCGTRTDAQAMNCTLHDKCKCTGAESTVNCDCAPLNIEEEFAQISLKVSAEVIEVQDGICSVENSAIRGCYNCASGAHTLVQCTSSEVNTTEVLCNDNTFVIPCGPEGPKSTLHFQFDSTRKLIYCTVSCGTIKKHFTLSGILKYVNTIHQLHLAKVVQNSKIYGEFRWPDFGHINDVMLSWYYKTLFLALLGVVLALPVSYTCLTTVGARLLFGIMRATCAAIGLPIRVAVLIMCAPRRRYAHNRIAVQGTVRGKARGSAPDVLHEKHELEEARKDLTEAPNE